ncbi:hypothetical protein AVEN_45412-1, partial [Araneus ventricosus]
MRTQHISHGDLYVSRCDISRLDTSWGTTNQWMRCRLI